MSTKGNCFCLRCAFMHYILIFTALCLANKMPSFKVHRAVLPLENLKFNHCINKTAAKAMVIRGDLPKETPIRLMKPNKRVAKNRQISILLQSTARSSQREQSAINVATEYQAASQATQTSRPPTVGPLLRTGMASKEDRVSSKVLDFDQSTGSRKALCRSSKSEVTLCLSGEGKLLRLQRGACERRLMELNCLVARIKKKISFLKKCLQTEGGIKIYSLLYLK